MFTYTSDSGVPYVAVIVVMLLGCLAFLALGSTSAKVLNWILKSVPVLNRRELNANVLFRSFCTAATML
jgi:amino acid permease